MAESLDAAIAGSLLIVSIGSRFRIVGLNDSNLSQGVEFA
jgi:hypothetical protein